MHGRVKHVLGTWGSRKRQAAPSALPVQTAALKPTSDFKNRNDATAGLHRLLCHIRAEISETVVNVLGVCKVSRTLREFMASICEFKVSDTHSLVKSSATKKAAPRQYIGMC